MTSDPPRSSLVPLFVGGAFALAVTLGYAKYRFDRMEQVTGRTDFSDETTAYKAPEIDALDEAPILTYREVYVPVDAHAYHREGQKLPLEATLVLRNTNREAALVVKKIELFGEDGKRIRRITEEPFELRPFATMEFLANDSSLSDVKHVDADAKGSEKPKATNTPSHFIVQWGSRDRADAPLIETVMVDARGHILYARPGKDIRVLEPDHHQAHYAPHRLSRHNDNRPLTAKPRHEPPTPAWHAAVAPEPKYELIRYDSNMGLRAKSF